MLASWLKLLPNNDVEASVPSHAFFFERVCLFVPSKVHSPRSKKCFSFPSRPRRLSYPLSCCYFTSQRLDPAAATKNRRHTNCIQRVPLLNMSPRSRSTDEPVSVSGSWRQLLNVSRPCRFLRVSPCRGRGRCTCFCLGLPFASLLKSNNCLLFTRLTSSRRRRQGCVQDTRCCPAFKVENLSIVSE